MTDRLTDEQVAKLRDRRVSHAPSSILGHLDSLACEVQQYRALARADANRFILYPPASVEAQAAWVEMQRLNALRPKCPTCKGTAFAACDKWCKPKCNILHICPDCTDGFMPLDVWVGKLVDALRSTKSALDVTGGWERTVNHASALLALAGEDKPAAVRCVGCECTPCQPGRHK